MRRFVLFRSEDVSGVSGTGIVAEGIQFTDGRVSIRWFGDHPSTVDWDCLADAMAIHGHNGSTTVRWLDDEQGQSYPQGFRHPALAHIADMDRRRRQAELARQAKTRLSHDPADHPSIVHLAPDKGEGLTRCCGRPPFELPKLDRMTNDALAATCPPGGAS